MIQERIDELIKIINNACYEYYVLDNPTITDQEYDDYYMELISLEKKYPEYKRDDSPTQRVGGTVLDEFQKIRHKRMMLSLANAFNDDDLRDFDRKIREKGI